MKLHARGIGRDPQDPRTLFVIFDREPSDDEMRAVHDRLRDVGDDDEPAGERPFAPPEAYETGSPPATVRFRTGEELKGGANYAAEAAMKCAEPAFKAYLEACHGLARPLTDDRCAQKVRSLCGVTSRRELNGGGALTQAWVALRKDFEAWRKRGRG